MVVVADPDEKDLELIEQGVLDYGISEVGGKLPRKWAFHITDNGELLGGATGRDHLSQFYLDNIWVVEERRLKGLGGRIHEEVVACAEKCGCRRILLSTLNKRAVKFYRKLGYEKIAEIDDYVSGFDLFFMVKMI